MEKLIKGNRIILLVLAVILAVFVVSCSQGGLEENTTGALSPDTYYKTKEDYQAAVVPMYRYFAHVYMMAHGQQTMYGGDDMTTRTGSNKGQFREWDQFNYDSNSGWLETWIWQPYWKTIHTANTILENLKNAPSSLSQDFKDKVAAQAHFMRGISYYFLVREFGGMPLTTSDETTGKESRSSVLDTYKFIQKDMQFSASKLPKTWGMEVSQRPTLGAAKTVLASLYLTWAGWPVRDKSKYEMAAQEAKEVMQSGSYKLLPNYADLWKTENDGNKETIFSSVFDLTANNWVSRMAQSYAPIEEKGWVDGYAEISFFKRFPPGPRKEATYLTTFTKSNGDTVNWRDSQFRHPTFKKWTMGGVERGGKPKYATGHNKPIFRYAHILLIYAEAKDMANGGPDGSAYNAINKVRERAGLNDLSPGMSQQQFQKAVLRERSYEFAGEWTRWFDMVRTETVEEYTDMRASTELPLINEPSKKYYISPIPNVDVERDPNLKQYPKGYPTGDQVK